jgi:hypothetical protein
MQAMMQVMANGGVHQRWCLMNDKMEYPWHSLSLEKVEKVTSIQSYTITKNAK